MNSRRRFLTLAGAAGVSSLVGCKGLPTREETLASNAAKFRDPPLLAPFYPGEFHKKVTGILNAFNIGDNFFEIKLFSLSKGQSSSAAIEEYLAKEPLRDEVATLYIGAVQTRGNTLRLYKSAVNKSIAQMFELPNSIGSPHLDIDQALIEFDRNDRMVSVFYRVLYTSKSTVYYDLTQCSCVYVGTAVKSIENRLGAAFLKDNELRLVQ